MQIKYTPEQIEVLRKKPRGDLNPSEFLALFRADTAKKQGQQVRHGQNTDEELYEVFVEDQKAFRSSNQFKDAVARAGLSISHGRAAKLHPVFMASVKEEAGMLDMDMVLPIAVSTDSDLYEIFSSSPTARTSINKFKMAIRRKGHGISHARAKLLFDSFVVKFKKGKQNNQNTEVVLTSREETAYNIFTSHKEAALSPYKLGLALTKEQYICKDVTALFKKLKARHEQLTGYTRPEEHATDEVLERLYHEYKPFKSVLVLQETFRQLGYVVPYVRVSALHAKLEEED